MELKKFVLLVESNQIMVVGVDIVKHEWQEQGKYYGVMIEKFEMRVIADGWNYPLEKLEYKTSDNILDLVEPCSLWDLAGDLYEYNIGGYVMIDKVFEDTDFSKREVTAIYKRQANGDYKRYEVVK